MEQEELIACRTCVYFDPFDSQHGTCHFNPPSRKGGWPTVDAFDWCGKHSVDVILISEAE